MQTSSPAERLKGPSVVQREDHPTTPTLVCHAQPIRPDPPRQDERGVFAILRKAVGLPTDFTQ